LKPEFLEIVRQSLAALAGSLSAHLAAEVRCEADREEKNWPGDAAWIAADVSLGESQMRFFAGFEPGLIAALQKQPEPAPSKTYDLLLDVELPVSVSFGRAQVPLKDVLKLTTGSIIELNRAIADPVEVIVNNCVIARGEVVTVDGNFGVRIQQVISRQERLRTLK
jgi:flagellar motor switch protein FliN/FliY